jgi:hypothetical protein
MIVLQISLRRVEFVKQMTFSPTLYPRIGESGTSRPTRSFPIHHRVLSS